MNETKLQAHRGVSSHYPENTLAAYRAAIEEGYPYIELDPVYTLDGELVIFHDRTLSRTARNKDGSLIEGDIPVSSLSYSELLEFDYGIAFSPEFRGEKIPLLREALELARENGVKVKIDNKVESFPEDMKGKLFALLLEFGDTVALTTAHADMIEAYALELPEAEIHYDGPATPEIVDTLPELGERLVVWVPHKNDYTWWVTTPYANKEMCDSVKAKFRLGLWLIDKEEDFLSACREFSPDLVETSGHIKPKKA